MILIIDYREKWFLSMLEETSGHKLQLDTPYECLVDKVHITCKAANLEVGDFMIQQTTHETSTLCIIERKTVQDLCASITDGRFRQQKERMLESVLDPNKILYIIEGSKKVRGKGALPATVIDGAIQNMVFKHNFKVLSTESHNDTFSNIVMLYKKFSAKEFEATSKTVAPTKLIAKGDKIIHNICALQLSAIPGVSYQTATEITKTYNTLKDLIDAYSSCETENLKEQLLASLQVTEKRKLGAALSKKIYNALCFK